VLVAQNVDGPCSGAAPGSVGWSPNFTDLCSAWANYQPAVQEYALQFAIYVIWAATGRRYGLCPVTVRPVYGRGLPTYVTFPAVFDPWGGNAGTYGWGLMAVAGGTQLVNFADSCVGTPPQIALPGPVNAVNAVTIDGVAVSPANYRLDGDLLVRQDGNPWPVAQDLSKPLGQPNTWSVDYVRGEPVPVVINNAVAIYACQVGKARTGGTCALPNKITSITRQGVSVQTVSFSDLLKEGLTGVSDVDQIILAVNPSRARSRPRVVSQDLPRYR